MSYSVDHIHTCPFCLRTHDASRAVEEGQDPAQMPIEDDISLCFSCGEWAIFDAAIDLRKPTDAEYQEIVESESCARLRAAWLRTKGLG